MNPEEEIKKLRFKAKWFAVIFIIYILYSTIFTILLIDGISNKARDNENSIYNIELAHMMEINNINSTTITQFSDGEIGIVCTHSYVEYKFANRCTSELIDFKNDMATP